MPHSGERLRGAVLSLVLSSCLQGCLGQDAGAQKLAADEHPLPSGETEAVSAQAITPHPAAATDPASVTPPAGDPRSYSIDTTLVVDRDVTLMSRMTGIVEEIYVDRGSHVRKGDALLKLINRDLALAVQRAEVTAKQRRADFARVQKLFAEGTVSRAQYEESQYAQEGADVDVQIAAENLEKSFLRAPFEGLIIERFARVGQRTVEDDNEPLFHLTTLSPLQARLYLPEGIARSLARGDRVEVRARHLQNVSVTGTIEWISRVIDASSGTSQAILSVPGGGSPGGLTPGTAVTVVIQLPRQP